MAFNSYQFLVFFPIVCAVYYLAPAFARWPLLLAASLYFVGRPSYALLLLLSSAVAYFCGLRIAGESEKRRKKNWLLVGLTLLLGTLFLFKYFDFFNDNVRALATAAGLNYPLDSLGLLLPLGISFYTFQLIGYLVDVYRGKVQAEKNLGVFSVYTAFFPKLVAGPIERAGNLLPQLRASHAFDYANIVAGLQLMAWGFFKKVVVADRIAPFVNQVYENPQGYDGAAITFATWLFAFQMYCDFSGYSDIAIGAAQTLGIKLMDNFNRPYFATSIQDFWKRWHISLSTWLTDYLYTPMTRQRVIKIKLYYLMTFGLFITFVLSGLWHGANWTFVAWGALHGAYLMCSVFTRNLRGRSIRVLRLDRVPRLHHALRVAMTFGLVCFAYIWFKASSVGDAFYMSTHLHTGWGHAPSSFRGVLHGKLPEFVFALSGIAVVMGVDVLQGSGKLRERIAARPAWIRWSVYYACTISVLLLGAFYDTNQQFIYFRF